MSKNWISIDTVIENGTVHVLQQRVDTAVADYGWKPHRTNEHRLVPLSELEGVAPNDADVGGVDRIE